MRVLSARCWCYPVLPLVLLLKPNFRIKSVCCPMLFTGTFLNELQESSLADGFPMHTVWNPVTNPRDKAHLMPIITPAYPAMNSSYNVGEPQMRLIRQVRHGLDDLGACWIFPFPFSLFFFLGGGVAGWRG